ncbi:group 1 glycosyl transferase [Nitrosopumilus sp. b3]|uniref:glycosyltransferase family 4 protein n=1 Tax=Nitrosopumilus sp. b3 TaxID=2109909 RepID=UPI0015F49002|nr:glycosyltransferase family 4 protein [Nitrosopumilus sp. b3]KAF6246718.1 group 1 glycosyl transferase [Nitrosopumilus sp. b3]
MKIAIVCPAFLPATQFGGILFLALDIAKEVSKKQFQVTVYTTDLDFSNNSKVFNKRLPRIESIDDFKVRRSHVYFNIELFFINFGMYKQIINDQPEIIHTIGIRSFQSFLAAIISKIKKIPLITSDQGGLFTHPDFQNRGKKRILYKIQEPMIKFIIKQSKKIIVANEYEQEIFSKYCDSKKLVIIRNGVDLNSFQKIPFDFKKKHNMKERMILFLGRFAEVKGIDVLLEAFSELIQEKEFDNVKLVIMGTDFGYSKKMFKKIKEKKLNERVLTVIKPDREEVISAYHACEFLVLPSRWEMSPLTPLEGFACKKTTIGSRIHGIPYVIKDNENGLLFENENFVDLKEKMKQLLLNPEKCQKLGVEGYKMVEKSFNNKVMCEEIFKLYNLTLNLKNNNYD